MNNKNTKKQNKSNTTESVKRAMEESRILVAPLTKGDRAVVKTACRISGQRRSHFYREAIIDKARAIIEMGAVDVNRDPN